MMSACEEQLSSRPHKSVQDLVPSYFPVASVLVRVSGYQIDKADFA
jgi:hypothetical protein